MVCLEASYRFSFLGRLKQSRLPQCPQSLRVLSRKYAEAPLAASQDRVFPAGTRSLIAALRLVLGSRAQSSLFKQLPALHEPRLAGAEAFLARMQLARQRPCALVPGERRPRSAAGAGLWCQEAGAAGAELLPRRGPPSRRMPSWACAWAGLSGLRCRLSSRRGVPQPCHALEVKREKRSSGGVRSSKFSNRVTNNSLCGLKFYYRFSKVY